MKHSFIPADVADFHTERFVVTLDGGIPEILGLFTVTNDGRVGMTANKNTIYGVAPYYRTIEAAPADEIEFNG